MNDTSAEATALDLDDKFHDECGLFGVYNHAEAANVAYLGLYALQHRGQESAGIASTDGQAFHVEKAMGWVADVFSRDRLKRLPGHRAIGHVRYSTAGSSNLRNAQPISANTAHGPVAIAHNGNLVNAEAAPRRARARRRRLPVVVRHRGDPAPARADRRPHAGRPARQGAHSGPRARTRCSCSRPTP